MYVCMIWVILGMLNKMKFFSNKYIIAGLLGIFLLQSGCNNQNKWKAVPLKIKKQESYNYSEMISGELDSIQKSELEEVRKNISRENKDVSKLLNKSRTKVKLNILETIKEKFNNIYNWFLNLF